MEQDVRYFQFLAGSRNGEVVIFDKIEEEDGMVFICFRDGSRCNEELILPLNSTVYTSELMAEVDNPSNLWTIKEEWVGRQEEKWAWQDETNHGEEKVCIQPFVEGKRKIIPIPPRPSKSKFGQINTFNTTAPQPNALSSSEIKTQQQASTAPQPSNLNDPIWLMCEKAKKFEQEITMNLTVTLPKQSLYDVAKESFEEGGPKVIEYIIHNLDDKLIKESLKRALLEAYDPAEESSNFEIPYEVEAQIIGGSQVVKKEK